MDWVVRSLQGEVLRYKSGLASRIFVVAAAFMACLFLTYMQYAYAEMPVPPEPHIVKVTIKRAKAPEPPEPSVVKVTIKRSQGLEPPEPSVVKVTIKRSQGLEPPEPSVVKVTIKRSQGLEPPEPSVVKVTIKRSQGLEPPEPSVVKVTIKRAKGLEPPEPSVVKVTIKRSQGLEPPEPSVVKVTIKRSQAPEPPEPSVVKITLKREKARDTADQYLIDPNALFKIPDVQGSMTGFQALSVEPPRITLTIGKISQPFKALSVRDGGASLDVTDKARWYPGPDNYFTCPKAGKFTVSAEFEGASGSATVTCEEDWSVPAFEPPVSSARDRDARVPQAGPGEYTWYAFCDPRSGEVTYGQQLPTGRKIMAGPFPGPRTAYDWIEKNCSRWRCTSDGQCATEPARAPGGAEGWYVLCERRSGSVVLGKNIDPTRYTVMAGPFLGEPDARQWTNQNCSNWRCDSNGICAKGPARGGEWKVLCGRNDLKIYIGKTYDATKFILVQEGFLGEPNARAWANERYPNWVCAEGGAPVTGPRMGGRWTVVCSKQHGGVSLTQYPDRVNYYVWGEGFFGEPDARRWTDQNCPGWRCNAQGRCLTGVVRSKPEDRPLEVPPETGRERERTASEEMRRKEEPPRVETPAGQPTVGKPPTPRKDAPAEKPPKKEYLSDAEAKALQKELWDKYYQKWKDEWCINRPKRKKGSVNWSGCLEFPLNQLLGLQRTAWGARTRAKQNVVRKLAQCYDKCIMTDTPQPVLDSCIKDCIKQNPMPK